MSISYDGKEHKWDLKEISEEEAKIIVAMGLAFWSAVLSAKLGNLMDEEDMDYPDIGDIPNSAFHKT